MFLFIDLFIYLFLGWCVKIGWVPQSHASCIPTKFDFYRQKRYRNIDSRPFFGSLLLAYLNDLLFNLEFIMCSKAVPRFLQTWLLGSSWKIGGEKNPSGLDLGLGKWRGKKNKWIMGIFALAPPWKCCCFRQICTSSMHYKIKLLLINL